MVRILNSLKNKWAAIINYGVRPGSDLDEIRQIHLFNSIRYPSIVLLLSFGVGNFLQGSPAAGWVDIAGASLGILATIPLRMGYSKVARYICTLGLIAIIVGMHLIYGDSIHTYHHVYTFTAGVIIFFNRDNKHLLYLPVIGITLVVLTLIYGHYLVTPIQYTVPARQSQVLDIISSAIFNYLCFYWLKNENFKVEGVLQSEKAVLNNVNAELTSAKRTLEKNAEHMIQRSKMTAIGEMGSGMAHEINNPLTVAMGNLQLIIAEAAKENPSAEKIQKYATMSLEYNKRIQTVVRALRHYSSDWEDSAFETSDMQSIINDTLALLGSRFREAGTDLLISIGTDPVLVNARPAQISQALLTLLFNAFEATRNLEDKWIHVIVDEVRNSVKIKVIDSGDGIPKSIQDKLMQPFFTTKEVGQGKGLGLSTARAIIDQHGGTLTYDSESPKTCFVMTLPSAGHAENKKAG